MCASPTVVSHLPTHPPRWETGTTLLLPSLLGCCREPGDALCLQSPAAAPTPGPPPTRGHATTCRFPTTGEQRGLHIPPCQAPVVLCTALEEAYFFGVHGEMTEEMILDFSTAWGGPEDVQGHGGAASH